jgi:hypothetical protein
MRGKLSVLLFGLLLPFPAVVTAQEKPKQQWTDPQRMEIKAREAFEETYRKAEMRGVVTIPKNGLATVTLIDLAGAPKGFAHAPVCELTEHGKPTVSVTGWEETNRADFFSFKGKPGKAVEWKCVGWTRKDRKEETQ